MPNQYVNKVQLADGTVILDVSSDTITVSDVSVGVTFHLPSGATGTGTLANGDEMEYGLTDNTLPLIGVGQVGYMEI